MEKAKNEMNLSAELFFNDLVDVSRAMELEDNEIITTRQAMVTALRNLADEIENKDTVVQNEQGWFINGFQYDKSYCPRQMQDKITIKFKK